VVLDGGAPRVEGIGSAYRVARDGERLGVTVTRAWSGARTES
jgi:hypothetical protein